MRPEALKFLYDVLQACDLLEEFTQDNAFDTYMNDALLRSAVERQFMIVGEAMFQALRIDPSLEDRISDARRIVNFRHVMVHDYATVDDRTVWGVVQRRLPTLRNEVEALLAAAESER
jgi:uncharacterized protein with HEPN domain